VEQIALESELVKGSSILFTFRVFEKGLPSLVSEKPPINGTAISPTTLHLLMAEEGLMMSMALGMGGKSSEKWGFTLRSLY